MPTLIVRTDEPLMNIYLRGNSGDWRLTDPAIIAALNPGGVFEVHPLKTGDPYDRFLQADIIDIVPLPATPSRKVIHFINVRWLQAPVSPYTGSWVVKYMLY